MRYIKNDPTVKRHCIKSFPALLFDENGDHECVKATIGRLQNSPKQPINILQSEKIPHPEREFNRLLNNKV